MKNKKLKHNRSSICNIHYHIVWSVKYRRKVLTRQVETELKSICQQVGKDNGFTVSQLEVGNKDHVHCFITATPNIQISTIVKMLKGTSVRLLFQRFPILRQKLYKHRLWNPSYYVETIGSISEDSIKKYIQNQQK